MTQTEKQTSTDIERDKLKHTSRHSNSDTAPSRERAIYRERDAYRYTEREIARQMHTYR